MEMVSYQNIGYLETVELRDNYDYHHDDHRVCKNCFIKMKTVARRAGLQVYCPFCNRRIRCFYTWVAPDYEHPDPYVRVVIDT
jgi:hypothetical protein